MTNEVVMGTEIETVFIFSQENGVNHVQFLLRIELLHHSAHHVKIAEPGTKSNWS